ncbi:hypothetical protein ACWGSK_25770 [Nocardiopsis sp. NPDC055551]
MEIQGARPVGRAYVEDSLVLETRWEGEDLTLVGHDLLAVRPSAQGTGL